MSCISYSLKWSYWSRLWRVNSEKIVIQVTISSVTSYSESSLMKPNKYWDSFSFQWGLVWISCILLWYPRSSSLLHGHCTVIASKSFSVTCVCGRAPVTVPPSDWPTLIIPCYGGMLLGAQHNNSSDQCLGWHETFPQNAICIRPVWFLVKALYRQLGWN